MKPSDYLYSGKVLTTLGYCMDFKLTRLMRLTTRKFKSVVEMLLVPRKRGVAAEPVADEARNLSAG
jgi:hypothetical protein